jgi:toxin ParE1/3/4
VIDHRFLPEALAEYEDAASWYGPDGGLRFIAAVEHAIDEVCTLPLTWPTWFGVDDLRRRVVPRFPYSIIYVVEPTAVLIVAVAHHSRRPGYWLARSR